MEIAQPKALTRGLLVGLTALRVAMWVWMATVFLFEIWNRSVKVDQAAVPHPVTGVALIAAAGVFTAIVTVLLKSDPNRLLATPTILAELFLGGALLLMNEWVWEGVTHAQSLSSAWPVCGVLAAGLARGRRRGVAAGVALGLVGYGGILIANDGRLDWSLARISTGVLFALSGWAAGYLTNQLRMSERLIASAQAREEVARTLHDGVLQTLAVIQRRSGDDDLAQLAREQERELRSYLSGAAAAPETLAARVRSMADSHERHHHVAVQLIVAGDLVEPRAEITEAVAGAVQESLNNVAKHADATTVTIYLEPTDDAGVFCSVKDDGVGFDVDETETRIGIERSIRGRIDEIGGRVEIRSRPGRGTEVQVFTSP